MFLMMPTSQVNFFSLVRLRHFMKFPPFVLQNSPDDETPRVETERRSHKLSLVIASYEIGFSRAPLVNQSWTAILSHSAAVAIGLSD